MTSKSALFTARPVSVCMTSATSSALPAARAKGCVMSVIRADVLHPAPLAVATSDSAKASASASVFMKAPEPHLTSSTKA